MRMLQDRGGLAGEGLQHFGDDEGAWEGEVVDDTGDQRAVEKVLERRRRARETPLSQKWFKQKQKTITPAQKRSLQNLWQTYGVDLRYGDLFDPDERFGRTGQGRRRVLDIGFGMGDSIAGMAENDREGDFVGVELHR